MKGRCVLLGAVCSRGRGEGSSNWSVQECGKFKNLLSFWRRQWHPAPVLLPGKSHGRRSLERCNPWGRWGSDTTEWLHFHFSLSCIGEGNGNPLQCSCLENPRDGGAWWVAIYGVAQSRTRLKWLSSSSSTELLGDSMFWEKECVYKLLKDVLVDAWKNQELQKAKVVKIQIPLLISIIIASLITS